MAFSFSAQAKVTSFFHDDNSRVVIGISDSDGDRDASTFMDTMNTSLIDQGPYWEKRIWVDEEDSRLFRAKCTEPKLMGGTHCEVIIFNNGISGSIRGRMASLFSSRDDTFFALRSAFHQKAKREVVYKSKDLQLKISASDAAVAPYAGEFNIVFIAK